MKRKCLFLFFVLFVAMSLSVGCGKKEKEETTTSTEKKTKKTTEKINNVTLYIGQKDDFGKYNWPYTGDLTPDILLSGIADTTGWNLSLDKKITKKTDGYIFCFSKKSVFYTGQKLKQSDEFYIEDQEVFYTSVLDSIKRTFQEYYKENGKAVNVYYWGPDDTELSLLGTGKTLPKDMAYKHGMVGFSVKKRYISPGDANSYIVEGTFIGLRGDEIVEFEAEGRKDLYMVTYTALKAIFKGSAEGRKMKVQVTEDVTTGQKMITKIY